MVRALGTPAAWRELRQDGIARNAARLKRKYGSKTCDFVEWLQARPDGDILTALLERSPEVSRLLARLLDPRIERPGATGKAIARLRAEYAQFHKKPARKSRRKSRGTLPGSPGEQREAYVMARLRRPAKKYDAPVNVTGITEDQVRNAYTKDAPAIEYEG